MEDLIHAFGIDGKLIVVQIINFVILLALLSYFLYRPILKVLQDREDKIAIGIQDAEDAAVAKQSAEAEKQRVLEKAHKEAGRVASEAKAFAEDKAVGITSDAQAKAEHIIHEAGKRGQEMQELARKESEKEVAKTAVLAAEKILREKIS